MDQRVTVFDKISNTAAKVGHGRWKVELLIYDGKVVGFDEIEKPLENFRENRRENG